MKLHKSQVFLILLLSFLGGVFMGQFVDPQTSRIAFFVLAIGAIVLVTIQWGNARVFLIASVVITASFGVWYFQKFTPEINENHIASFNDKDKISWEAVVVEEPDVRENRTNLTVRAAFICHPDENQDLVKDGWILNQVQDDKDARACVVIQGKVLLTVGRYPEYEYGDLLEISGKLETPFETDEFSYKNYLSKDDIYSTARFSQVKVIDRDQGHPVKSALLNFKAKFSQTLSEVIPEPQNSLLLGLLVGARRSIPEKLLEDFKTTGVTHIIAISGFNISIITRILGRFIQRLLGIRASLIISTLVVVGFVIITGAQASVVRAAIMGILVVIALNIGRASTMVNALVFTGAVMVAFNPRILIFDVGFQLSFLATAGLIYFADDIEKVLHKVPKFFEIRSSLAATLSAQIFVLPLLIFYFDQLSIIAPLVNVLILPIIPWAMLFGFVSGALGMIWVPLSFVTAWITWALLSYQVIVVEFFAKIPFAAVAVENISLSWVLIYYVILFVIIYHLVQKRRERRIKEFYGFAK